MKEAPGSSETSFLQEPHGVTTQKTPFFIVTAVKTSNLTQWVPYTRHCYSLKSLKGILIYL
jgi:hypothetical protein